MMLIIKQNELKEFYNRWKEKANAYNSNSLEDYYDQFFTLFVIYNRIYNVVIAILSDKGELEIVKEKNGIKKDDFVKDNKAATICIAHYLSDELKEIICDNRVQIDYFINIIKYKKFYIDLYNGKIQPKKDNQIKKELESGDDEKVVENLLIILYKLRCNMFHAEKSYNNDQIAILKPANFCLNYFIERLMPKVMAYNSGSI